MNPDGRVWHRPNPCRLTGVLTIPTTKRRGNPDKLAPQPTTTSLGTRGMTQQGVLKPEAMAKLKRLRQYFLEPRQTPLPEHVWWEGMTAEEKIHRVPPLIGMHVLYSCMNCRYGHV